MVCHDHVFIDVEEGAKGRGTVSFMWVAREKAGVASRVGPRRHERRTCLSRKSPEES